MDTKRENFVQRRWDYLDVYAGPPLFPAGIAYGFLLEVPTGFHEKVERISTWGNSAGTPEFEVFISTTGAANTPNFVVDRTRRVDFTSAGNNDIADEFNPVYIDNGFCVLGYWSSANNGDHFQASFQISLWEKWPKLGHRIRKVDGEGAKWKIEAGAWVWKEDPATYIPEEIPDRQPIEKQGLEPWTEGTNNGNGKTAPAPTQMQIMRKNIQTMEGRRLLGVLETDN